MTAKSDPKELALVARVLSGESCSDLAADNDLPLGWIDECVDAFEKAGRNAVRQLCEERDRESMQVNAGDQLRHLYSELIQLERHIWAMTSLWNAFGDVSQEGSRHAKFPEFAQVAYAALHDSTVLTLTRLTDPPEQRSYANLSLTRLIRDFDQFDTAWKSQDFLGLLEELRQRIGSYSAVKEMRNKEVAHASAAISWKNAKRLELDQGHVPGILDAAQSLASHVLTVLLSLGGREQPARDRKAREERIRADIDAFVEAGFNAHDPFGC